MKKIAICGRMGTGKTSLANYININYFKEKCAIGSFANFIKQVQSDRGFAVEFFLNKYNGLNEFEKFNYDLEKLSMERKGGEKPRKEFQYIGDYFIKNFGKDFLIDKFFQDFENYKKILKSLNIETTGLIIDDLRKENEYDYLIKNNFIIIGLEIPENERMKIIVDNNLCNLKNLNELNHPSEKQVDFILSDLKAQNLDYYYEFESNRRIIINREISKNFLNIIFDYFNRGYNMRGIYEG